MSWLYVGWLGKNVDEIVEWKIPAVKLAVDVHTGAYDASLEQLNYLLYENPETHAEAKATLKKMEQDLSKLDEIGRQFDDQVLLDQSAHVRRDVTEFKLLYERGVQMLVNNAQAVKVMVKTGDSILLEADSFALKQQVEYATLYNTGALQEKLNSKVQKYILVNKIKSVAYSIIQHEKQERLFKDRSYYRKMQQELPGMIALFNKLEKTTEDKVELDKISAARNATEKYTKAAAQWIKNDNELKNIILTMNTIAADARKSAATTEYDGWLKAEEVGKKTVDLVSQAHLLIVFILLVGAAVGIGISVIIPRNITSSINALSEFSKRFGQGDLTARTNFEQTDEIGEMAKDFDKAASNLQAIIRQVNDNAIELTGQSSNLSESINKSTYSIQTQKTTY